MEFLNKINDELLEDIVYDYEDELEEMDVDEIIANLKSNISDYIYDNPDEAIPDEPPLDIDFGYVDDDKVPDELIEEMEPKDNIFKFFGK